MTYRQVEQSVLLIGALTILGGILFWVPSSNGPVELIGQALLFAVLLAAVRFGRRGGFAAAISAAIVYVLLQLPQLSETQPALADMAVLALRLLSFGALGILGGEVFMRLRYNLRRLEGESALDEWSRVYNQRYLFRSLTQARSRHIRYREPVSVVVLALAPSVLATHSPARRRSIVRRVADYLRSSVRVVDEVGRLDDGRFIIVLPHTPTEGGFVVRERSAQAVQTALGAQADCVATRIIALPQNADEFDALLSAIGPSADDDQLLASGTYSSAAVSTRNPAAVSTSSAPAASTLKTSTASPEGSTKQ